MMKTTCWRRITASFLMLIMLFTQLVTVAWAADNPEQGNKGTATMESHTISETTGDAESGWYNVLSETIDSTVDTTFSIAMSDVEEDKRVSTAASFISLLADDQSVVAAGEDLDISISKKREPVDITIPAGMLQPGETYYLKLDKDLYGNKKNNTLGVDIYYQFTTAEIDDSQIIASIAAAPVTVAFGTSVDKLTLPDKVTATMQDNTTTQEIAVEWDLSSYQPFTSGEQTITGQLINIPEGYYNVDRIEATVEVTVETGEDLTITGPAIQTITVDYGTSWSSIELPQEAKMNLNNDDVAYLDVEWDNVTTPAYDRMQAGTYTLSGTVTLPAAGLTNPEEHKAQVQIVVEGSTSAMAVTTVTPSETSSSFVGQAAQVTFNSNVDTTEEGIALVEITIDELDDQNNVVTGMQGKATSIRAGSSNSYLAQNFQFANGETYIMKENTKYRYTVKAGVRSSQAGVAPLAEDYTWDVTSPADLVYDSMVDSETGTTLKVRLMNTIKVVQDEEFLKQITLSYEGDSVPVNVTFNKPGTTDFVSIELKKTDGGFFEPGAYQVTIPAGLKYYASTTASDTPAITAVTAAAKNITIDVSYGINQFTLENTLPTAPIEIAGGTDLAAAKAQITGGIIGKTGYNGQIPAIITWDADTTPSYNPNQAGDYVLSGTFAFPEGYTYSQWASRNVSVTLRVAEQTAPATAAVTFQTTPTENVSIVVKKGTETMQPVDGVYQLAEGEYTYSAEYTGSGISYVPVVDQSFSVTASDITKGSKTITLELLPNQVTEYEAQGAGGQTAYLHRDDVTVVEVPGYDGSERWLNVIGTNLSYEEDIVFHIGFTSGMNAYSDAKWATNCMDKVYLLRTYDDEIVANWLENPTETDPAQFTYEKSTEYSKAVKFVIPKEALAPGTTYQLVLPGTVSGNNAAKTLKYDVVYQFTTTGSANPDSIITDVTDIADISVDYATSIDTVAGKLPTQAEITTAGGSKANVEIQWDLENAGYDAFTAGTYEFKAKLIHIPDEYSNVNGLYATVKVVVGSNPGGISITAESPITIEKVVGTAWDKITLPEQAKVQLSNGDVAYLDVVWEEATIPAYDPQVPGTYALTGHLTVPDTIANPTGIEGKVNIVILNPDLYMTPVNQKPDTDAVAPTMHQAIYLDYNYNVKYEIVDGIRHVDAVVYVEELDEQGEVIPGTRAYATKTFNNPLHPDRLFAENFVLGDGQPFFMKEKTKYRYTVEAGVASAQAGIGVMQEDYVFEFYSPTSILDTDITPTVPMDGWTLNAQMPGDILIRANAYVYLHDTEENLGKIKLYGPDGREIKINRTLTNEETGAKVNIEIDGSELPLAPGNCRLEFPAGMEYYSSEFENFDPEEDLFTTVTAREFYFHMANFPNIEEILTPLEIQVPYNTSSNQLLTSYLPKELTVRLSDGTTAEVEVDWSIFGFNGATYEGQSGSYSATQPGTYVFPGAITVPSKMSNLQEINPSITVELLPNDAEELRIVEMEQLEEKLFIVPYQTTYDRLGQYIPDTLTATLSNGQTIEVPITWGNIDPAYNEYAAQKYTREGVITVPNSIGYDGETDVTVEFEIRNQTVIFFETDPPLGITIDLRNEDGEQVFVGPSEEEILLNVAFGGNPTKIDYYATVYDGTYTYTATAAGAEGMLKGNFEVTNSAAGNPMTIQLDFANALPTYTVDFAVQPSNANVVVKENGVTIASQAANSYLLAPGEYTYTVTAEDYTEKTGSFTVNDQNMTIEVALNKANGNTGNGGGGSSSTAEYTLTFDANGGSDITAVKKAANSRIDLADYTPTREGYTFAGWYSDADLTKGVSSITLNANTTVYAKWIDGTESSITDHSFTDVTNNAWYAEAVKYVYANGLMNGTDNTTFSPNLNTTRGMIVAILYRLEGSPTVSQTANFTDVADTAYYATPVAWAATNGIVKGYNTSEFGPNDAITREQLAQIFYGYAVYKGYDTTQSGNAIQEFNDYGEISDWAMTAMIWANAVGLINGMEDNMLNAGGNATRAEVAAMLQRFCENVAK